MVTAAFSILMAPKETSEEASLLWWVSALLLGGIAVSPWRSLLRLLGVERGLSRSNPLQFSAI